MLNICHPQVGHGKHLCMHLYMQQVLIDYFVNLSQSNHWHAFAEVAM